jgi:enamine deaminase RidA (YjgF/YER057c/UK114 family)
MIERHHVSSRDGARRAEAVIAGGLIFFSGLQADELGTDAGAQLTAALHRLDTLMAELGETQRSLLMVHLWLKDMADFAVMNAAWNAWADQEAPPARTCVSGALSRPEVLVEVVAIAACSGEGR